MNAIKLKSLDEKMADIFWSNVNMTDADACWDWTRYIGHDGYGRFYFEGKVYIAHRVAYMLNINASVSRKIIVRQKCGNKKCCNPAHFDISTRKALLETMAKNGKIKGFAQLGEDNHSAKLTEKQVIEIKKSFQTGKYSFGKLSKIYRVSRQEIGDIINGERWKWVHVNNETGS